jgi:hypothetical protein
MVGQTVDETSVDGEVQHGAPPYISYLTFKNCIDWLATEGVPLRFDRSFWSKKYSGSLGPQLMGGLRFLGLLAGEQPTSKLEQLVHARGDDRKECLRALYRAAYTVVDFGQLERATTGMLKEWFDQYTTIEGATQRKAESFFINALKDADVPLSNPLKKMARNKPSGGTNQTGTSTRKPRAKKDPMPNSNGEHHKDPATPPVDNFPRDRVDAQDSLMLWGLFKCLPKPGMVFPSHERDNWIEAAKTLFNLEYKDESSNGR